MPPPRLTAQPIAEGFTQTSSGPKLVWRDFRWNTGKVIRDWHIDPNEAEGLEIEVRQINTRKPEPETF